MAYLNREHSKIFHYFSFQQVESLSFKWIPVLRVWEMYRVDPVATHVDKGSEIHQFVPDGARSFCSDQVGKNGDLFVQMGRQVTGLQVCVRIGINQPERI